MKRSASIRDKFCFKTQTKASFRHLATYDRRALYLRRAFFGEILLPPHLLGKISLPPAFRGKIYCRHVFWQNITYSRLSLHSADFSYRVLWGKISPPFAIGINRAVCFVVNFTAVRARFNRRSFIEKRSARNKARSRSIAGFYLFSAEPQILKFSPHCFAPKFR